MDQETVRELAKQADREYAIQAGLFTEGDMVRMPTAAIRAAVSVHKQETARAPEPHDFDTSVHNDYTMQDDDAVTVVFMPERSVKDNVAQLLIRHRELCKLSAMLVASIEKGATALDNVESSTVADDEDRALVREAHDAKVTQRDLIVAEQGEILRQVTLVYNAKRDLYRTLVRDSDDISGRMAVKFEEKLRDLSEFIASFQVEENESTE